MQYKYQDVKAKCLFCEAMVEGNQRSMVGSWHGTNDLTGQWMEDKALPRWLCNGVGNRETAMWQVFYLCPKHNNPHDFDIAWAWANERLQKGEIVDFTDPAAITLPPSEIERLGKEPSLPDRVPDLGDIESREKLPNTWQVKDSRLGGCLEIANTINDVFDWSSACWELYRYELEQFPKPLELAQAMKKAAKNIELLTMSDKPTDKEG